MTTRSSSWQMQLKRSTQTSYAGSWMVSTCTHCCNACSIQDILTGCALGQAGMPLLALCTEH